MSATFRSTTHTHTKKVANAESSSGSKFFSVIQSFVKHEKKEKVLVKFSNLTVNISDVVFFSRWSSQYVYSSGPSSPMEAFKHRGREEQMTRSHAAETVWIISFTLKGFFFLKKKGGVKRWSEGVTEILKDCKAVFFPPRFYHHFNCVNYRK